MNVFPSLRLFSRTLRSSGCYLNAIKAVTRQETRQIRTVFRQNEWNLKLLGSSSSQTLVRNLPRFAYEWNTRFYTSGGNERGKLKQSLSRILRVLFLVTGGAVWSFPALLYFGYLTGIVEIDVREKEETDIRRLGNEEYNDRMLVFYNVPKNLAEGDRAKEIGEKQHALMQIWNKLKIEDGILRKFGQPVQLCGFQVMAHKIADQLFHSDDPSNHDDTDVHVIQDASTLEHHSSDAIAKDPAWKAACYIEGPKLTGVMQVEFSKFNSEWIPVSIHLETIQKTGEVICDVSGPLPNGVTRFTRLSND